MSNNELIKEVFGDLSIDKNRLPSSDLTAAGVPSFVAEWLLDKIVPGTGPLTAGELEKINDFVKKALPRKDDRTKIMFDLSQGNTKKLIALLRVRMKMDRDGKLYPDPVAEIKSLNFDNCRISTTIVERHEMLLRQGVWGKIELIKLPDDSLEVIDFEPFQCSRVNISAYAELRERFTSEEWKDLLFCSMGFNSQHPDYTQEAKTWVLARLLPLVEPNFHVMELAPKGTGKSFVFENISSKVSLISGGKVTPARLFFDGKTKEVGLLGCHDVVVLDEVQSLTFDNSDEVIGPLKNYLASGRYNRAGFADISSDCSLVMLANIELNEQLRPKNEDNLIRNLPKFFGETALLDRFAGIIPGWEIPKFQRQMIADGVGLKMDFFGEVLLSLRRENRFSSYAREHTYFDKGATVRDQNAILKSAAGFLKLLYPHLQLTLEEYDRDCLQPACRLRQYIRNCQYHLDDEFRQLGKDIYVEPR